MVKALQPQFKSICTGENYKSIPCRKAYHIPSKKTDDDHDYGGFGETPKFPMPHNLLFLLRYWYWSK
jgi:uncharacterized protein YyaL (SSP411 family)